MGREYKLSIAGMMVMPNIEVKNKPQISSDNIPKSLVQRVVFELQENCSICKGKELPMYYQPYYNIDDAHRKVKVTNYKKVCRKCSDVINCVSKGNKQEDLNMKEIIEHFTKVNECSIQNFFDHYDYHSSLFNCRRRHTWEVDYGSGKNIIKSLI